jgi:excisionase family DNA binding protein
MGCQTSTCALSVDGQNGRDDMPKRADLHPPRWRVRVPERRKSPYNKDSFPESIRWMSIASAASYLEVHPQTIRRLIHSGDLRASKIGHYRVDRADLDQLLLRRKKFFAPYRRGSKPWVAERHAENRGVAR